MLTLLRHGLEETANALHGWQDVDLVDKGVDQALRAAEYFQETVFRHAYTSDLKRAAKTAAIVAEKQNALVPMTTPMLRSINLGMLNGKPYAEIQEKFDALWAEWRNGNERLRAPEGESWEEFQGRIYPFLFRAHQEAAHADVLGVTHSHVVNYAAAIAANGGRPLYGNALDLVKSFDVRPGNAVQFVDGKITRINFIPHDHPRIEATNASGGSERPIIAQKVKDGLFALPEEFGAEDEVRWAKVRLDSVRLAQYADSRCGLPNCFDKAGAYLCGGRRDGSSPICNKLEGSRCLILSHDVTDKHAQSCMYWEVRNVGDAETDYSPKGKLDDARVSFGGTKNALGFGCSRCEYGQQAMPRPDSEGRPRWCALKGMPVEDNACCAENDPVDLGA